MSIEQAVTRPAVPSTIEREALIRVSDTISDAPLTVGAPPIYDFDEALTGQVRNDGHWSDAKFPIGRWPHTGNYAAVLLAQLRVEQRRIYGVYEQYDRTELPDAQVLKASLGKMVIGVINWAPRRSDHRDNDQNGDDFYLAELDNNVQIFSQLPFLEGVAGRGLLRAIWRIKEANPIWPAGEQFRSSIVSQLRNFPEGLEIRPLESLPEAKAETLSLAFGDKYGNARLEKAPSVDIPEIQKGEKLQLIIAGKPLTVVGATRLTEIAEDQVGIYVNPADAKVNGYQYLELVRRVSDPNDTRRSAYEALRSKVNPTSTEHPDWTKIPIELTA